GFLPEAIAAFQEVLRINPQHVDAHYELGVALHDIGRLKEAGDKYKTALRIKPDYARALCSEAQLLKMHGKFKEALAAMKHGHELAIQQPALKLPSAVWVRECGDLVAFENKVASLVKGEYQDADGADRVKLARVFMYQKQCDKAVQYFDEAF